MNRSPDILKIALIDHYDSFTFNVIEWLKSNSQAVEILHVPFDDPGSIALVIEENLPIVLSPGPNAPQDVKSSVELCQHLLGKVPILGICLGHQTLATIAGAKLKKSPKPFHGSTATIRFAADDSFYAGVSSPLQMAIYHSLMADPDANLNDHWQVNAWTGENEIMGIAYNKPDRAPAFGIQYHPESFMSEQSEKLLSNFLKIIDSWNIAKRTSYASATAPLPIPS